MVKQMFSTLAWILMGGALPWGGAGLTGAIPQAQVSAQSVSPLRPPMTCPQDVEVLTAGLLRDLPGYANRVARRTLGTIDEGSNFGTVLLAGRAEFEPIPLDTLAFDTSEAARDEVQQVFFTTLERRYSGTEAIEFELYHWLFLVPAEEGWRLVFMFSRATVDETDLRPPTPRQESSDGIVGQAVQLWLRDCRAGAVYPIEAE